jgi:hypothetical protein
MQAYFPPCLTLICFFLSGQATSQTLVGVGANGAFEIDVATGSTSHVLNMANINGATDAINGNQILAHTPLLNFLMLVDVETWSYTMLGSTGWDVEELAFDEARRELYGTSGAKLMRVNPSNGQAVQIGPLLSSNPWVAMGLILGLDYDLTRDRLVGTDSHSLWEIDKTTGMGTWIGAHNSPGLADIYCDPSTGAYWGVSGPASQLVEVNPLTGLATHKAWLTDGPFNGLASHGSRDTGTSFCVAVPNSTGQVAETLAYGAGLVSVGHALLATEGLPVGRPALLIASQAWSFLPPVQGTVGYQCVIGNLAVFRDSLSFADASGRVLHEVDLTALPTRPTSTAVQPGETWHFQAWYRDDMGGSTTNFSLPTRIVFQ